MRNKLLFSFILFFLMLSIFSLCFASTDLEFSDGNNYNLPDFSEYVKGKDYCIVYGKNSNIGTRFVLLPYDSSKYQVRFSELDVDKYSLQLYPIDSDFDYFDRIKFDFYYISDVSSPYWNLTSTSDSSGFYFSGGIYGVYTTKDLLDLENNILFSKAPLQVKIPAIQQVEEIPQVMEQVMKILIPVGLIVFGIGLVIYLTRLVISRLT